MRNFRGSSLQSLPVGSVLLLLLFTFTPAASAQQQQAAAAGEAELPRFHKVSERLFRGGQPRAGGIRRLAEMGINTIVNLRSESSRRRLDEVEAESLGLSYYNIPLPIWGRPDDERVRRVLEIIAAPESGLVFIHCKDGVDRTGTVAALYRIGQEGWTIREALAEADRRGMRRVQYWMRDYVEDYGQRKSRARQGIGAMSGHHVGHESLGDHIGVGMRIAERETFRAGKVGERVLRRAPGAIGGFLSGIF